MRDLPAYDQIIQGLSGVMAITGSAETGPFRVGYPISDTIGGLTAAMAICAALNGRDKNGGAFIDVSMLEATLATMGWVVSNFLISGIVPEPFGNENFTSAPSGTFAAKDGPFNIAANKQEQFELLCRAIARDDLIDHPAYKTRELRKENRYSLKAELEKSFREKTAQEWSRILNAAGVPAGAVLNVPDILAHPQIADRGMLAEVKSAPGTGRDIRLVRTGVKINGEAPSAPCPPPMLGEHNRAVYGEFGFSSEEISSLMEEGVI